MNKKRKRYLKKQKARIKRVDKALGIKRKDQIWLPNRQL